MGVQQNGSALSFSHGKTGTCPSAAAGQLELMPDKGFVTPERQRNSHTCMASHLNLSAAGI